MKLFDLFYSKFQSLNFFKILLYIILFLIVLISIIICYLTIKEINSSSNVITSTPKYLNSLIISVGILIALITLIHNTVRNSSMDFLDKSTSLLQQAYSIFSDEIDENGRPNNDRLHWLTVARMIQSGLDLSQKISLKSHKKIFQEVRQFWRWKFSIILHINEGSFPLEYFAEKPEHALIWSPQTDRAPLALESLGVIYRFVRWPENIEDPIEKVPMFSKEEIKLMKKFGPYGLAEYLESVEEIMKKKNT